MKISCLTGLAFIVVTLAFYPLSVPAQIPFLYPITVSDSGLSTDTQTMYFGNAYNATYGIDSVDPSIREVEGPPLPPNFNVRWVNTPGRVNVYGAGLLIYDIHGLQEVDTFALLISNLGDPEANFTFRWPDSCTLSHTVDSMFLIDAAGRIPRIDMFSTNNIVLTTPVDSGPRTFYVFKYGFFIIDDSECAASAVEEAPSVPGRTALGPNYPNPFNPSTVIDYELSSRGHVEIKVYDVLGREVAALVNEQKPPGEYSVQWNAEGMPSGVYFYRMQARQINGGQAGSFTATKKLLLLK